MFNGWQLKALDAAKIGTSGRLAYALVCWAHDEYDCAYYDYLAAQMGVSLDRAQRVVADLRKAGLVTVTQEYKQPAYITPSGKHYESDNS